MMLHKQRRRRHPPWGWAPPRSGRWAWRGCRSPPRGRRWSPPAPRPWAAPPAANHRWAWDHVTNCRPIRGQYRSHHVAEVELGVERGVGLLVEAVPGALPLKPLVHFSGLLEQEFKNYGLKSKLKYNKWITKINLIFLCLHAHGNWSTVGLDIIQNRLWK